MKLVEFPEQSIVIAKDQPEYLPLPAHRFEDAEGRICCCWSLSWRERLRVLFSGRIWHQVLTFHKPLQPQLLMVQKPIMLDRMQQLQAQAARARQQFVQKTHALDSSLHEWLEVTTVEQLSEGYRKYICQCGGERVEETGRQPKGRA